MRVERLHMSFLFIPHVVLYMNKYIIKYRLQVMSTICCEKYKHIRLKQRCERKLVIFMCMCVDNSNTISYIARVCVCFNFYTKEIYD